MSSHTVVLITGVGRGIGKALAAKYLLRPNHVVIGSVRDSKATKNQELKDLPTANGSRLVLVSIESSSLTDPASAVKEAQAEGISCIDIVIANAGISPTPAPPELLDIKDVIDCLNVNTVSPILLFQAARPLLEKSKAPIWLSVSSGAASITNLEIYNAAFVTAYGASKAGLNFFTVAVHTAHKNITAFAIHPGLVQTEMGNMGARMMGMTEAPNTLEESASKTIAMLDKATRKDTSGRFYNVIDGTELPW